MASTLLQLRAAFQFRWDRAGSTVLTTAEQNTLINSGYRALWAEVTGVNKSFRISTDTFTLVAGTQTKAFPVDFQETLYVRRDPGTDQQTFLMKYGAKTATQMYTRTYRPQGTNLYIEPIQRCAGNYAHDYIPQPPVLTADGDTIDAELDQWRDYSIIYAVIEALAAEESPSTDYQLLLYGAPGDPNNTGIKGKVMRWAAGQRSADPDMIEDVRKHQPWMWTPP